MNPVKLGIVLVSARPGGTELSVLRLLRALDPACFEPHVCVLTGEGPLVADYRAAGLPVTVLGADRGPGLLKMLGLRDWIRRTDPDLLHGFLYAGNLLVRAFGREGRKRPVVVSIHGIEEWRAPILDALERPTWARADAVLANSQAARKVMLRKFGSGVPVHVVRNGSDPMPRPAREVARARLGLPGGPLVLCVANFIRYKRHLELIFAFQQVRLAVPSARLVLTSEGPERARCERSARELGIQDAVLFLGRQSDLSMLYAACDVVTLASSEESYPGVLLEAAWAGRPVVATAVGGVPELVVEGVTGHLVPPLEARPMAQALIGILEDRERREAMGEAALSRARKHFTMAEEARLTTEFYDAVMEGRA